MLPESLEINRRVPVQGIEKIDSTHVHGGLLGFQIQPGGIETG
jgi:hypothetical protein